MALVVKRNVTITGHPSEPDARFVVRVPLSAGDLDGMQGSGEGVSLTFDLLTSCIQEWSYEGPVSLETVKALDLETFAWLNREILAQSKVTAAEKNELGSSSSPITEPDVEPSPASSTT